MGFLIGCVIYIAICQIICKVLEIKTFNKQALVYAVVGSVGGFIVKATMGNLPLGGSNGNGNDGNYRTERLEGIISNYPIIMDLQIEGDDVSGTYYYKKNRSGEKLYLHGSIIGNHLELNERNREGMNTGHFDGTFKNNTYSGTFVNYKGIQYQFHLSN